MWLFVAKGLLYLLEILWGGGCRHGYEQWFIFWWDAVKLNSSGDPWRDQTSLLNATKGSNYQGSTHSILGDPGATSQEEAIFSGKVYFKSWRAPENLFLQNQFQKWSNSAPLIGQKNIFSAQSARMSSQVPLSPSYTKWFYSSIDLLGLYRGKIVVETFRKKDLKKPMKSQAVTWGLGNNILPLYRKFLQLMLYAISTLLLS